MDIQRDGKLFVERFVNERGKKADVVKVRLICLGQFESQFLLPTYLLYRLI
jgi:hypothetical protein